MFRITLQDLVAGQDSLFGTAQLEQNVRAIGQGEHKPRTDF